MEFEREIEGFKGDSWFVLPGKIVLWIGVSEEACTALQELVREEKIHACPSHPLVYFYDGRAVSLPLAKQPPRRGYKDYHWLPVTYSPGPYPR